ncbi:hypothetical protein HQ576_20110, partial [bacterium]|nr:hypothetical protein [bacterium]
MKATRLLLAFTLVAGAAPAAQVARGRNLLVNGSFEDGGAGWRSYGTGFAVDGKEAHSGRRSIRCTSADPKVSQGVAQTILLDPPVQHPFRVSGWSKALNAQVGQDYDVYLDCFHDDETPLWGQIARFRPGTHGWQYTEHVFHPAKPIRRILVFAFIRKTTGTVWFDDLRVELLPFELRQVSVLPGLYGGRSIGCFATTTLPCSWKATLEGPEGLVATQSGSEAPIQLSWCGSPQKAGEATHTLRIEATDALRGETLRKEQQVTLGSSAPPRGYAVWTESSMRRVFPHSLPARVDGKPSARIALAGREDESFQIALLAAPGQPLKHVAIDTSDLVCEENDARIPARHVQWQQVGYVKVNPLRGHPAMPDASPGWWPDPLLPVERFDVPPGFAQALWVTVHAPSRTPPGSYRGTVVIRPKGKPPTPVRVQATIYGFDLPVTGHLKTA